MGVSVNSQFAFLYFFIPCILKWCTKKILVPSYASSNGTVNLGFVLAYPTVLALQTLIY